MDKTVQIAMRVTEHDWELVEFSAKRQGITAEKVLAQVADFGLAELVTRERRVLQKVARELERETRRRIRRKQESKSAGNA
jgi:hypothetical protein